MLGKNNNAPPGAPRADRQASSEESRRRITLREAVERDSNRTIPSQGMLGYGPNPNRFLLDEQPKRLLPRSFVLLVVVVLGGFVALGWWWLR